MPGPRAEAPARPLMFQSPRTTSRGMRRASGLAVTTLVCVLLAVPAGALADPDPEQGFGYNVQSFVRPSGTSIGVFSPSDWPTYLGLMRRDGITVGRADALWRPAEPAPPSNGVHTYAWATADAIAGGLAAQGVRWDAVLGGSPAWAGLAPNNQFGAPTPGHYGDYAAFAAAFAARYGQGGTFWAEHPELPVLPVQKFEIWNEPNTSVHWGTTPDPAAYAVLFRGAQVAIKAVLPSAEVVVGGIVWNDDVNYLNGFFGALGPSVSLDGLGSHPYAPTVYSLAANVVRVRRALDALGRSSVPLEINELGWPAAYDRAPASRAVNGPVADLSRAATMALTTDALTHSTCNVGSLQIYDLVEAENNPAAVESLMGLYRRDGSTTLTAQAYSSAVARYRTLHATAPGTPPVPVCGARGATATRMLPLTLSAAPAKGGCTVATVTYRGQPLEEAQVAALAPYARTEASDADGKALLCPPSGRTVGAGTVIRLTATVPDVAGSNLVQCLRGSCRPIGAAATCALSNVKLGSTRRLATVVRDGLRVTTSGCTPQLGAAVRVRTELVVSRAAARSAGLVARAATVAIGRGTARLDLGRTVTVRTRLTTAARRALRTHRRLAVTVRISAREGATTDQTTRKVTLHR
jgi:hypothetical protein